MSYKSRLNILLIVYSFAITVTVLFIGFVLLNKVSAVPNTGSADFFITSSTDELRVAYFYGLKLPADQIPDKLITNTTLQNMYREKFLKSAMIVMLVVFLTVMVFSFLLAGLISKRLLHPAENMASSLESLANGRHTALSNDIFSGELTEIKNIYIQATEEIHRLLTESKNLSSYISHEQKNSLAVLRAKLQLGDIQDAIPLVDKMTDSIDDILAMTATENMEHNDIVDLELVCAEAVDIYRKMYPDIQLEIDEDHIPIVKGREIWLARAVCNLIENAIKYGNNSSITVSTYKKNGSAILCVADGGMGIHPDQLDKIFDLTFRADKRKKDGYGIGLSLVSNIAQLCGGLVWAESDQGKGSKFFMVFPAQN